MTRSPVGRAPKARFGSAGHLARRFTGSLWPGGPGAAGDGWACSFLTAGERQLWFRMNGPDRRHAVAVARTLAAGGGTMAAAIPAALLHDVGKIESGLGVFGRAVATVAALVAGQQRLVAGNGRVARYLRHDTLGAALLEQAGSDGLTVAWAREHHLAASCWTVPQALGCALKAADND